MDKRNEDLKQLTLSLPSALKTVDSAVNVQVTLESLKLLLYQRCQIPEPIKTMQRNQKSTSDPTPAERKYSKKCSDMLESLNQIEVVLRKVASFSKKFEVAIGLGATLSSLKEIFTVTSSSNENDQSLPTHFNFLNTISRQLCLHMVQSLDWMKEMSPTRVFVFVNMLRPDRDIGVTPWNNFKILEKKHKAHIDVRYDDETSPQIQKLLGDELNKINQDSSIEKENSDVSIHDGDISFLLSKISNSSKDLENSDVQQSSENSPPKCLRSPTKETSPAESCLHKTTPAELTMWFHIPIQIKGFKS